MCTPDSFCSLLESAPFEQLFHDAGSYIFILNLRQQDAAQCVHSAPDDDNNANDDIVNKR